MSIIRYVPVKSEYNKPIECIASVDSSIGYIRFGSYGYGKGICKCSNENGDCGVVWRILSDYELKERQKQQIRELRSQGAPL